MMKNSIHIKSHNIWLPSFLLILVKVEMAAGNRNLIAEFHILPRFDDLALLNIRYLNFDFLENTWSRFLACHWGEVAVGRHD